MPVYVYLCTNDHTFEEFSHTLQKSPEGPECPTCGAPTRKVPTGFRGIVSGGTKTFYPGMKENK